MKAVFLSVFFVVVFVFKPCPPAEQTSHLSDPTRDQIPQMNSLLSPERRLTDGWHPDK